MGRLLTRMRFNGSNLTIITNHHLILLLLARLLIFCISFGRAHLLDSSLNEPCVTNCDCRTKYSICKASPQGCASQSMRFCKCAEGYRADNSLECRQESHLGQKCGLEFVCVDDLTLCNATTKKCECDIGFKPASNGRRCVPTFVKADYGQPCSDVTDCDIVQDCIDQKCKCLAGYKYSADKQTCIELVLNDPCVSDADCMAIDNSQCSKGTCVCSPGYKDTVASLSGQNTHVCVRENGQLATIGQRCYEQALNPNRPVTYCQANLTCSLCPKYPFRYPTESVCVSPPGEPTCTVPKISNGRVSVTLKTRTDVFPVRQGIFAQVQCDNGYRITNGASSGYCDDASNWTTQLGQCQQ